MAKTVDEIMARLKSLQSDRVNFDSHWQEVADYVIPRKGNITSTRSPGSKLHRTLYDSTAPRALSTLAAGLHGQLTSPSSKWFKLRAKDPDLMKNEEVKVWFGQIERRTYDVFNGSNFNSQVHEMYIDMGAFGIGNFYSETDPKNIVRFDARPCGECYIAENEAGLVDTAFREFTYTARQMEQRWGASAVSDKVRKKLEKKKYDDQIGMLHAVYPRDDYNPGKADSLNLPWASMYIEIEEKHLVSEKGYHEFPYAVPRWEKASDETYGRSPAMNSLPDVKMVNAMEKTILRAAQKIVDPPLMLPFDGYIMPVRMSPGSLIMQRKVMGPEGKIEPLLTKANLPAGMDKANEKREAINQAFFVDLFLMLDMLRKEKKGQVTATEILERVEEKMIVLGPTIGRLFSEFLNPLIERVFGMMLRAGMLPPMPEILEGQEYIVEYVSPLARAQRMHEVTSIQKSLSFVAPIAEVRPEVLDKYNWDKTVDYVNDILGVPPDLMLSDDQVEEIRVQRQEAQAAQRQIELAAAGGQAAKEVGAGAKAIEDVLAGAGARA